ncbi:restriction endonuclease subunit S [Halomonas sp. CH40]
MSEKQALIPRLRFPEFWDAGEWRLKKLGDKDVSSFVKKRVPVNDLDLVSYVSTENILPDFDGINVASKLPPSGSFTSYKPKDILIANIRPYLKKVWVADRCGAASNDVIVVRPMQEVADSFLSAHLKSEHFIDHVMKGAKGVKMPRGDISLIKEYPLAVPDSKEQQKIADCLSSLDELISAQAEKIDALKTHKKGLMQKLFPREGETVPRLRFPEFQGRGEWKTSQLQDLGTIIRGASPRPRNDPRFYDGDIPRLMGQDVSRDGKWVTPCIDFLTKEGAKLSRLCQKGTLTIICSGDVGIPSFLAVDACIHDGFLALVDIDMQRINVDYLYYCLVNLQRVFNSSATHGGIYNNLTTTILKEFSIGLPYLEEQQMIANCLSSLDSQIAAQIEKLDALKTHKKGLMQKLFPSVVSVVS